jgi:tRNA(fMet)-specific endonuclease VapC
MSELEFLLDTNILSELIKDPAGSAAQKVAAVGAEKICTSIIVARELRYGAEKKGSVKLEERVERLLEAIPVLPPAGEVDRQYAKLRHSLTIAGRPIGPNDLLIAAQALHQNLILVTRNLGEFSRIESLMVEAW